MKLTVRLCCHACFSSTVVVVPAVDRGHAWEVVEEGAEMLSAWDRAHFAPVTTVAGAHGVR